MQKAGTHSSDKVLFKIPFASSATIFFPVSYPGKAFKVKTNGEVSINGSFVLSSDAYIYFGTSFTIA